MIIFHGETLRLIGGEGLRKQLRYESLIAYQTNERHSELAAIILVHSPQACTLEQQFPVCASRQASHRTRKAQRAFGWDRRFC